MISERQFQEALTQINAAFANTKKVCENLEKSVQKLQQELDDLKPRMGRPKKEAA